MQSKNLAPGLAVLRFEPHQLTRIRELRGLTKTALAQKIDKTPSAITQFELGDANPDKSTLAAMALAMKVPIDFFARKPMTRPFLLDECHFRSLRSTSQYKRRSSIRSAELLYELMRLLESEGIEFPNNRVDSLRTQIKSVPEIETLANRVRENWGLGQKPITKPINVVESKGVVVLPLNEECEEVDAFSTWVGSCPIIVLNMNKPSSRIHFDVAHELGHLLMHEDVDPGDPEIERQADFFAACLLLPRPTFVRDCPNRWSLGAFESLKMHWHVSIQAMVFRAHKLGCLSTSSYRYAFKDLSRRKLRRQEPCEWTLSKPQALQKGLSLVSTFRSLSSLAKELGVHDEELERHLGGYIESAEE